MKQIWGWRSARVAMAAVVVAVSLLEGGAAGQAAPGPFTLDPLPAVLHPGQTFTVTGSGCPATGTLDAGPEPLALQLHSPGGAIPWALSLDGSTVMLTAPAVGVAGTVDANAAPAADGTFSVAITIPADAPPDRGYSVDGICTTLLESGGTPSGFSQASLDAAHTTVGGLTVEAAPAPPAAPLEVDPGYTG